MNTVHPNFEINDTGSESSSFLSDYPTSPEMEPELLAVGLEGLATELDEAVFCVRMFYGRFGLNASS